MMFIGHTFSSGIFEVEFKFNKDFILNLINILKNDGSSLTFAGYSNQWLS